jgi:hypothetical protein
LILNTTFNRGWSLKLNDPIQIKKTILNASNFDKNIFKSDGFFHGKANGFGNFWWISLKKIIKSGRYENNHDGSIDFTIIAEYDFQNIIVGASLLSVFSFVALLAHCGYSKYANFRGRSIECSRSRGRKT